MKKIIIAFVFMMFVNVTSSAQTKDTISNGLQLFDSLSLGTVIVTAQKPVVKMETDKLIYRVNEDVDSKSSTVLDILRKVPMVTVDGQDNITVNGSSSFKVYVDGKPNVMMSSNPSQIFKSLPASVVKNIEVVTNPGARYDAEGAGGVLNIIMNGSADKKQLTEGYTGTLKGNAGLLGGGGSASVSGSKGKMSYNADVFYNFMHIDGTEVNAERRSTACTSSSSISYHQKGTADTPFTMGNMNLGYDLDSLNVISVQAELTLYDMRNWGNGNSSMYGGIYGKGFQYSTWLKTTNQKNSFSGHIDYQHFFDNTHKHWLGFSYQLSYSPLTDNNRCVFSDTEGITAIDLTDRYSHCKENNTDHTFTADYTVPVGGIGVFNTGSKLVIRNSTSDAQYYLKHGEIYLLDSDAGMDYHNNTQILAGYAEYELNKNKVKVKGGLRYEQTWQDVKFGSVGGENLEKKYGNLVPTASFTYSIVPTVNIGLAYNMRISRPGISYLNPYCDRSNPTSISYGNTGLDAEKTHNISLVGSYMGRHFILNVDLHHNICSNEIEEYCFTESNILNTTYGNVAKKRLSGINVYANWSLWKNSRLIINGGANYADLKSRAMSLHSHGWQGNIVTGLQQKLPWDMSLSSYLVSSTKVYSLQGWNSGFNLYSGNISKSCCNKLLNISLSGVVGLNGGKLNIESYSHGTGFIQHYKIKVPISNLSLDISYTFGNMKSSANKKAVGKDNDEFKEKEGQGSVINNMLMPK